MEGPIYVLRSAFYNVRSGVFGSLEYGREQALPTFSRRGRDQLIVARVSKEDQQRHFFFPDDTILYKVLIDPATFKTKTGEIFIDFNDEMVPRRAVIEKTWPGGCSWHLEQGR